MELTIEEMQELNGRHPELDLTEAIERFKVWDDGAPYAADMVPDKKRRLRYWLDEYALKRLDEMKHITYIEANLRDFYSKQKKEVSFIEVAEALYNKGLRIKGE